MTRYYECRNARSNKFYRMRLSHLKLAQDVNFWLVLTWRDKIGQYPGQLIMHGYAHKKDALQKMEELHELRVKHGYTERAAVEQLEFALSA